MLWSISVKETPNPHSPRAYVLLNASYMFIDNSISIRLVPRYALPNENV